MKKIILASESPVRRELFNKLGVDFSVEPSGFDERSVVIADPDKLVKALALAKAKAVAKKYRRAVVVGADTMVVLGNEVFGKPKDAREAKAVLNKLNGSEHSVITGIAVYDSDTHKFLTDSAESIVRFKTLTPLEIEAYVKSGEPFGKAGGYAVQGLAGFFVDAILGDYSNVLGLPVNNVARLLGEVGVKHKLKLV